MEELVSVIVPVYNIEDYLPRCLACLEMQTYKNLEIILVDDGSTDGTGKICDEYAAKDPRARVIHHPENRGLWAARNTGQDAAQGEYLWFPDGDDYFHKDIIKVMYEAINRKGKEYDLVLVRFQLVDSFDSDIQTIGELSVFEVTQDELINSLFTNHYKGWLLYCTMWNKLFRRRLINDLRSRNYKRAQDWDFCIRTYWKTNIGVAIDNVLYYWVQRPDSLIHVSPHHIVVQCKIRMIHENIMQLPSEMDKYRGRLLYVLYKQINAYQYELFGTDNWKETICLIRPIIADTWFEYLHCKGCSLGERLIRLFIARFPIITRPLFILRSRLSIKHCFSRQTE